MLLVLMPHNNPWWFPQWRSQAETVPSDRFEFMTRAVVIVIVVGHGWQMWSLQPILQTQSLVQDDNWPFQLTLALNNKAINAHLDSWMTFYPLLQHKKTNFWKRKQIYMVLSLSSNFKANSAQNVEWPLIYICAIVVRAPNKLLSIARCCPPQVLKSSSLS